MNIKKVLKKEKNNIPVVNRKFISLKKFLSFAK